MSWFTLGGAGEQQGPFALNELKEQWMRNAITGETFCWTQGQPDWLPISQIHALLGQLQVGGGAPPPPPKSTSALQRSHAGNTVRKLSSRHLQSHQQAQRGSGWVEKKTIDGMSYYYNMGTEEVSWDKPEELKTPEELKRSNGELVWVSHEEEAWVAAQVTRKNGDGSFDCRTLGSRCENIRVGRNDTWWPIEKESSLNMLEEDLVMLDSLNEAQIIHNLRERYRKNEIYTWVGGNHTVLVSVNPFKPLPLYTPEVIELHRHKPPNRLLPPHVFAVANDAYEAMLLDGKNQSILISGESGAGKTEATKQCLNFLADAAGSDTGVEQRILEANPLLEAFGNAKTLRNNNSSRFGKWIEIHFNRSSRVISGARILNYLLEKSRVVYQQNNERNYHIFYQLCQDADMARKFELSSATQFSFTGRSGCITVDGIDDHREFQDVIRAMQSLEFSQDEIDWTFRVTCGVLHLGNVDFVHEAKRGGNSGSNIAQDTSLQRAAKYLDVGVEDLRKVLCFRSIEVRGERSVIPLDPDAATGGRDSLAKTVYASLFDWLVKRVNESIRGSSQSQGKHAFIGALDIFGFEIFENNSFEQLCINFANEKLQQHFNRNTFKEEEQLYKEQQVKFTHVKFIDNQPVLDLVEKRPIGLMLLLDEEVRMPKGSDETFVEKLRSRHNNHPRLVTDIKRKMESKLSFDIEHYAGTVQYDAVGFLDKNRDTLFQDMYDLMGQSRHKRTSALFPPQEKRRSFSAHTLSNQFRKQLNDLMTSLYETDSRYIRCIKPNDLKLPDHFNSRACIDQLRYSGVFEAVEIRKCGYPFRYTHKKFAGRYACINHYRGGRTLGGLHEYKNSARNAPKALCEEILASSRQDFSAVEIGTTMVLYRTPEHRVLELLRNLALESVVPVCQRVIRGSLAREFKRRALRAEKEIAKALQIGNDIEVLDAAIKRAAEIIGTARNVFDYDPRNLKHAKELRFKLQEWVEVTDVLERLIGQDINVVYFELGDAVQRAQQIMDIPHTDKQQKLFERAKQAITECAALRIDPEAEDALYVLDRSRMEEVSKEAKKIGHSTPDLVEINRLLSLAEEDFVKLQLKKAVELKDPARTIHREIRLKELYLDRHGPMFVIERFRKLRDPYDYANSKMFGLSLAKDELAQGMLKWTNKPIHTSLVDFSNEPDRTNLVKEAKKVFKAILGYMGDRKYPYVESLAAEVLAKGMASPTLCTEIFLQIVKQLTDNPSNISASKGWELLGLCLMTFPPPDDFEYYLSMWLRKNAPSQGQKFFSAMHNTQYGEKRYAPPSADEIPRLQSEFASMLRSRYSVQIDTGPTFQMQHQPPKQHVQRAPIQPSVNTTAPPPPPKPTNPPGKPAIVLYDYDATQDGLLTIRKDQIVYILEEDGDWWMAVDENGSEGWIPAAYVQLK